MVKRSYNALDRAGEKIHSWTIISFSYKKNKRVHYLCRCDCGKEAIKNVSRILMGYSNSCGCRNRKNHNTHGLSRPTRPIADRVYQIQLNDKDIKIFESRFNKKEPDKCWEWDGYVSRYGYGRILLQKKVYPSHRISYALYIGDPGKKFVCHKCDNRKCVNPNHLFLGTQGDNMLDMAKKGNALKKLTVVDREIILEALNTKQFSFSQIGKYYNICTRSVAYIKNHPNHV